MTDRPRIRQLLAALLISVLVSALLVTFLQLTESRQAYLATIERTSECQLLAKRIRYLRERQAVASSVSDPRPTDNQSLLELVDAAGIPGDLVESIEPVAPVAIPNTQFQRIDAFVRIRGVSTADICKLILAAKEAETNWIPTSIACSYTGTDRSTETQPELWTVELGLTHLIHVAKSL